MKVLRRALPPAVAHLVLVRRMRRFSWLTCILTTALHFYGTNMLWSAAMRNEHATFMGQQPQHEVILKILAWVWLPLPIALKPLLDRIAAHFAPDYPSFDSPPNLFLYSVLIWSLIVGIAFGFLVPRLLRRRRQASNHAMERTPTRRSPHTSHD